MPKQPTKKSQDRRKVKCRKCHIDMVQQATIEGTWDLHCLKCGLRHVGPDTILNNSKPPKLFFPDGY